ncbi:MAG TPA: hypothetical protein VIS96_06680 [Terrimicrobiaceae bacterium]
MESKGGFREPEQIAIDPMHALKLLRISVLVTGMPLAGVTAQEVTAQEASPTPDQLRRGVWKAELPGGAYIVRLSAITSVSLHEYVVDGAARVAEVNIATSGSELARFYFIEPYLPKPPVPAGQRALNAIESKTKEVSARVETDDLRAKVVKSYPTTTHAHTVEYRLGDRESLNKLFSSVEDAWLNGRAGLFKP